MNPRPAKKITVYGSKDAGIKDSPVTPELAKAVLKVAELMGVDAAAQCTFSFDIVKNKGKLELPLISMVTVWDRS